MLPCVFIWPCYHQGTCSVFVLLHPTLYLPAVQQRWTRRESCDKGSFSLLHHHPLRGSASPAKVSSSPTTSLWPQTISYMGQQGGGNWKPFDEGKNGHKRFCQAHICYFGDKCVVFARNCKIAHLIQYNMQYARFLTQKSTFFAQSLP